jgi:hypothetical protein
VNRTWQPAIPQAMQRHGGRTRPPVPASARPVVTASYDSASDQGRAADKTEHPTSAAPPDSKE